MKLPLAYIASSLLSSTKDVAFNSWCAEVGIVCPNAEVRTTPASVAGRGVFTTSDVSEGDVVLSIPYYCALTQENGRQYFPDLGSKLNSCRKKTQSPIRRLWNQIIGKNDNPLVDDDFWQAELTAYAIEAIETNHPWAEWISQWFREDPYQQLVNTATWKFDSEVLNGTLDDFSSMAPDISKYKVNAAVGIRLAELYKYAKNYQNKVPFSESTYALLTSRAIGISDGITACLPMHDMINHNFNPNVVMQFNEGFFEFVALRDIPKDSELFLSYMDITDDEGQWDEDKATWMLVQWGIPTSPCDVEVISTQHDDEVTVRENIVQ
ncbi:hypothetical protein ACHAXN_010164 [Cyclotella atomus]|jgi:hypothetical protein